ncbi:2Fe-2S iron-sulfur cluster-binding protein [Pinisolibacter sp.]|uniref:2Fe-2S iron-sulfur cluster-binding protein n=1 Tax=Pinisolibacter sp. TaxID=2172024 RepID=UPI002FDD7E6F
MRTARIDIVGEGHFEGELGKNLLREALRKGLGFPYDCNSGGCGTCQFELVEGDVADSWEDAPGLSARARSRGRRLACQSKISGDCTLKVRLKPEFVPLKSPTVRSVRLEGRQEFTRDMVEYTFRCDGEADFLPGQYALLRLPGVVGDRAYSMSNRPNPEGLWRFIVKRVPGGRGTAVLAENLRIGDSIELDGPYGMAHLRPDAPRDIVCIGGGSGLSPLKSICAAAVREPQLQGRRIRLFYGARTPSDLCLDQAFDGDPLLRDRVEIIPVVSDSASDSAWHGERGFVHDALRRWLEKAGNAKDHEYYFCGPPQMTDAVRGLLQLDLRVPATQLHSDRFA